MRIGGFCVSIVRICTGRRVRAQHDLVGRRRTCPACRARGGPSGSPSASKLCQSVSTCGPSATTNPSSAKICTGSRADLREQVQVAAADRARRQRDVDACARDRPARRRVGELVEPRCDRRSRCLCLTLFAAAPTAGLSAGGSVRSSFISSDTLAGLAEELRLRGADRLLVGERRIAAANSSPSCSRFAISSLWSLHERKRRPRCGAAVVLTGGPVAVDYALTIACERRRIADRDLGEHLAVELDVRLAELADQLAVADAERARGGVDALDPQRAEVALALLARPVHVQPRVLHRLVGDRVAACCACRGSPSPTSGRGCDGGGP